MSGTGPRGREARREETVKRVRNPEGGTYRVWNPGIVDLRAHVAVGARNPMKGAGAAQDSGGVVAVSLVGGLEPMRVPGASASGGGSSENRVVVETARREPGTE
jgi:hypothetical protein